LAVREAAACLSMKKAECEEECECEEEENIKELLLRLL
jgi:hypothetical protein